MSLVNVKILREFLVKQNFSTHRVEELSADQLAFIIPEWWRLRYASNKKLIEELSKHNKPKSGNFDVLIGRYRELLIDLANTEIKPKKSKKKKAETEPDEKKETKKKKSASQHKSQTENQTSETELQDEKEPRKQRDSSPKDKKRKSRKSEEIEKPQETTAPMVLEQTTTTTSTISTTIVRPIYVPKNDDIQKQVFELFLDGDNSKIKCPVCSRIQIDLYSPAGRHAGHIIPSKEAFRASVQL